MPAGHTAASTTAACGKSPRAGRRPETQQKALATDGTEVQSFESAVGLAVLDDEGLFRIHARGRHVLWIPDSDK